MDDLHILEEMIEKPYPLDKQSRKIELEEKQANAGYKFTITGAPSNCVVIKVDEFELLILKNKFNAKQKIFSGKNESRKKADYIIICDSGGRKRIFYIELKMGAIDGRAEIINKLKGAKCFMEYFRAIGREFWERKEEGKGNFLNFIEYEIFYIGFTYIRGRKGRPIFSDNTGNSPEEFFKVQGRNRITFQELIDRSC